MDQGERLQRLIRKEKAEGDTTLKCLLALTILTPEQVHATWLYLQALKAAK